MKWPTRNVYRQAIMQGIQQFYPIENMVVLGYTPGYNDNPDSSLIWMINELIRHDTTGLSAFLPVGQPITAGLLAAIEDTEKSVLLFGAAFGLVDLAERHPVFAAPGEHYHGNRGDENLPPGRCRAQLCIRYWPTDLVYLLDAVHSEYGMTELLSQVLCTGRQLVCVSALGCRLVFAIRIIHWRPCHMCEQGLIGIIDLANWGFLPVSADRRSRCAAG